uniref:Uncharacterized protein n=1 Tax=Lygus hesperus TaxID=30085 RepID=A0A0A9XGY1_LYGHE
MYLGSHLILTLDPEVAKQTSRRQVQAKLQVFMLKLSQAKSKACFAIVESRNGKITCSLEKCDLHLRFQFAKKFGSLLLDSVFWTSSDHRPVGVNMEMGM